MANNKKKIVLRIHVDISIDINLNLIILNFIILSGHRKV